MMITQYPIDSFSDSWYSPDCFLEICQTNKRSLEKKLSDLWLLWYSWYFCNFWY